MMRKWIMTLSLAGALFSQGLQAHGPDEVEDVPAGLVKASITQKPDIEGLQMMLLEGPRQGIMFSYQGSENLTVLGNEDEPFLRFSDSGVEANTSSATWQQLQGQSQEETGGGTDWTSIASSGRYAWMDPRLADARAPDDTNKRQTLSQWHMGLSHGGESGQLSGELYWHPLPQVESDESGGSHHH